MLRPLQPRPSLVLVLATAALALFGARPAQAEPRRDQCVILVSIDGLAHFYLDDRKAEMPTIRRLAREGARADGMVVAFPSVTWPCHTVLATGASPSRNGVIGNSYLDRQTVQPVTLLCDPVFDKDQLVKVPTIYDVAHRAGLKTASICWPATRGASTLDWTVPDMPGDDTWEKLGTKSWLAELREAGIPVDRQGPWVRESAGGVQRDWLYTRMAAQVLRKHQPNLVLIHLVEPDHVQHRTGPRSPEAYWCASYSDDRVRDLVEAVAASPMAGRTTIFVCSDHGFLPVHHEIRPNVVLRQLGLIELAGGKVGRRAAWSLSQGGAAALYVLDDARRKEITEQLRGKLSGVDGIDAVLTPEQFARLGQPSREQDPRAPDLWLAAKSDYSFSDSTAGEEAVVTHKNLTGTHGYLPDQPDMLAMCVVWGPGIKSGTKLGKIQATEVAPTIARLLGVELPSAEGKPLEAITGR
jgi:predicted AlkP superfamily pyrophosphatase or phosphodiesterase